MYLYGGKVWKVSDDPFDAELYRVIGPHRPDGQVPRAIPLPLPAPAPTTAR
jgi:hypothetical protein